MWVFEHVLCVCASRRKAIKTGERLQRNWKQHKFKIHSYVWFPDILYDTDTQVRACGSNLVKNRVPGGPSTIFWNLNKWINTENSLFMPINTCSIMSLGWEMPVLYDWLMNLSVTGWPLLAGLSNWAKCSRTRLWRWRRQLKEQKVHGNEDLFMVYV